MNRSNKPKTHLFSPHTEQCIYCGKSTRDDAIENTPCGFDQPPSCGARSGKGWLLCIAEGDHPLPEPHRLTSGKDSCRVNRIDWKWSKPLPL